jgi:penicillin-binding protein-related factor A (putative recombinase)
MKLEKDIQREILSYLNQRNDLFCWRNQSVGVFDPTKKIFRKARGVGTIKGVSDILGVHCSGRFIAIEVKSKTGRLSPDQKVFLNAVSELGGIAFMANSLEQCVFRLDSEINTNQRLNKEELLNKV